MAVRRALPLLVVAACGDSPGGEPEWMASIADSATLSSFTIPGTHDSAALHEPAPNIAKTQDLTIAEQLDAGIRYFDIRLRDFDDQFLLYHGAIDQDQTFDETLATMFQFLDAHPAEAVIMSVKEELAAYNATSSFEQLFDAYIAQAPARWYTAPTIPALGDVRGKIVLLRRFTAAAPPLGIDAAPWLDNVTFTIANGDATLRVEDYYDLPDSDSKWTAVSALITEAEAGDPATLYLTYTSGFLTVNGINNIAAVSDDIDARLADLLAKAGKARLGVLVSDHVTQALVHAMVATNRQP